VRFAVIALLLLVGCAYSPKELVATGQKLDFTSRASARQAADCIVRTTEDFHGPLGLTRFNASVRDGQASGSFEVVVTHSGVDGTVAFAVVLPTASGSRGTIWQRPDVFEMRAELVKGC
jgi:hypothetical protein